MRFGRASGSAAHTRHGGFPAAPGPCVRSPAVGVVSGSRSGVAVGAGPWGARGAARGFDLEVVFFDAGDRLFEGVSGPVYTRGFVSEMRAVCAK